MLTHDTFLREFDRMAYALGKTHFGSQEQKNSLVQGWYAEFGGKHGCTDQEFKACVDRAIYSPGADGKDPKFPTWHAFKQYLDAVRGQHTGSEVKGCRECMYGWIFHLEFSREYGHDVEVASPCGACKQRSGRHVLPYEVKLTPDFSPGTAFSKPLSREENQRRLTELLANWDKGKQEEQEEEVPF